MMKLICRIFGHRLPSLLRLRETRYEGTDGLGHEHYAVLQCCARCKDRFVVGYVSTPAAPGRAKRVW